MVPKTAFSKPSFHSSSAGLRLAFLARHSPKQPCGLVRDGPRAPRRSGPSLAADSMARGGPEFDCGQPRRHPFTTEGGLGPAEAGPPSYWWVRAGGGCLRARSAERVPATRRPIQGDWAGRPRRMRGKSIHKKPRVQGPIFNASWIGLDRRLPSSELRAHSRPGESQMEVAMTRSASKPVPLCSMW